MSVTINDCLKLPSLSGSKVVAGEKGLSQLVNSVSVLEHDDGYIAGRPITSTINELLITSFYTKKDDIDAQCRSIRYFKDTGNVGMVLLYVGTVIPVVSPKLIATANEINFPLIVLPPTPVLLRFSDIISDVMEVIFTDRKREKNLPQTIMRIMSSLPENFRTFDNLLQTISDHTKLTLFLTDNQSKLISQGLWPLHTTLQYENFEEMTSHLKIKDDFSFLSNEISTNYIKAPIVCNGSSYYIKVIDQNNNFSHSLLGEIEETLALFTSVYSSSLDDISKNALIQALILGNTYLQEKISRTLNLDINSLYSFSIVEDYADIETSVSLQQIQSKLYSLDCICGVYRKRLIILRFDKNHPMDSTAEFYKAIESLRLDFPNAHWLHATLDPGQHFSEAFEKGTLAISLLKSVYRQQRTFTKQDYEFSLSLSAIINDTPIELNRLLGKTESLLHHSNDQLLETLSVFLLDTNSEVKLTSQLLFLHRNTVQYRLLRIKTILGYDFSIMPNLFDIYKSCAIRRILADI